MRKRRLWTFLAVLLVLLVAGAFLGDRMLRKHGHPGLSTFLRQWARNYPKSFAVEPPVIHITVDEKDMTVLEGVVERARKVGVIEQEEGDEVEASFAVGDRTFKGRLRIKGKMTDHVEGKKWSFRVVARKDGGFLGMKRFSLQHPGTRNYLCDWFYHRLMQGEGVVALRYGFCKVVLNDEDLGVYAYEEHFGPELLENNGRLEGPLLRFDPSLFWRHRVNGMEGIKVDDAYGAYQAAALDAYGTKDIAADPVQRNYFEQALALMDAFRRGERPASEVFDVDRIARRLAIIDLIGGHHSMDWSDVKFYFNPATQRLEPVSYESFSAFPTKELAGAYRCTGPFTEGDELHTALFKDRAIFAAYVRHLERVSRQGYLDSTFAALNSALDTASATLYGEFPYKELDRGLYYRNQQAIRTLLDGPKGFHAYDQGVHNDTLALLLVPIESLPMQVDSVALTDGRILLPASTTMLPCRPRGGMGAPMTIRFQAPAMNDTVAGDLIVYTHVPGSSMEKKVQVFPFALRDPSAGDLDMHEPSTIASFNFLDVDERTKEIHIRSGAWTIDHDLVVPAGYSVKAYAPLRIMLVHGARIISRSDLQWIGQEELPILITSPDSSSGGIQVVEAEHRSRLEHVRFDHLSQRNDGQADVAFYRSDVSIEHTTFQGGPATLLDVSLAEVMMSACTFEGGSDQFRTHFAQAQLSAVRFAGAGDDGLVVEGGGISLTDCMVRRARGTAVKAGTHARVALNGCVLHDVPMALEGKSGSTIAAQGGSIDADQVAHAGKDEMRYGPVRIELKNVAVTSGGTEPFKCGAGSVILKDGERMGNKPKA